MANSDTKKRSGSTASKKAASAKSPKPKSKSVKSKSAQSKSAKATKAKSANKSGKAKTTKGPGKDSKNAARSKAAKDQAKASKAPKTKKVEGNKQAKPAQGFSAAAIFDLDRTLISGSSSVIFGKHLEEAGVSSAGSIPFADTLATFYEVFGENWLLMQPSKLAGRAAKGWPTKDVAKACKAAAKEIVANLQPFAQQVFDEHRDEGRALVLATTTPDAFVRPLVDELGFDDVVCTRWEVAAGAYTGRLDGPFVWGRTKADAVAEWCAERKIKLGNCYAYSDSYFDAPLLDMVGHPVAVNPDAQLVATSLLKGWPIRHLDKPEGVAKIAGLEIQQWARPFMRPELAAPYADITFEGVSNIPADGPAIIVFNHRSYYDPTVMGMLIHRAGRNARGLGKKEVFDVPVIGRLARALGGVRVERASGSDEPLKAAAKALEGGEVIMMAPQGTIPRGPAFFDPELQGRWGAAKLADMTRAPVIPVGLWGTELVWPRSARLPSLNPLKRPDVSASVGKPVDLKYRSADADTKRIMTAISAELPSEARKRKNPTAEELARTFPPGYTGDPHAEAERRPGTDS